MLSIIIPTLNEEKVLEKTLTSLKALDIVNYEIIVSDGASTDRTVEIAKKYADKVVVHNGKTRQNIAQGRNEGAKHAQGDFLVFMDADVLIPEINDFFVKALNSFGQNQNLAGLTVFLKVVPETVTLSDKLFFGLTNRVNQVLNNILHIGAASGEFQMIRADAFKKLGGYNPQMAVAEDNDLFARLGSIGRTKVETGLFVLHTSRRAHSIGWTRLLSLWLTNFFYTKLFHRSFSEEWKVIR